MTSTGPGTNDDADPPPTLPPRSDAPGKSLESIMADFLQQAESGQTPDPQQILRRYPQHADELQSFFDNHQWMAGDPGETCDSSPPAGVNVTDAGELVGHRVGPYCIESEIARGGMGVVYRARQSGLQRPVALKLIGSGVLAGPEQRIRFRNEAEAAANLQHPGIVPIHETGSWQGYEYFSMALVEGPTLQSWVQRTRQHIDDGGVRGQSYETLAAVVRDIARAVAYAHDHGIVHRDLKPENILMADGNRPMVTDFGLAKWHREGTVVTRTGQVLGTPNYMSPEQAAGFSDGDCRVDVYALGAILYALLCGRPPHEGPAVAEVLRSVLQDEPIAPRQICRDVPPDLEIVCSTAMRFAPDDRYESATAMADDLDRFLQGETLVAHHSGIVDVVTRELRRDQHGEAFQRWGGPLQLIGHIVLTAHVIIFALQQYGWPRWWSVWLPRLMMLGAILGVIHWARGGALMPRTAAERPLWSIWLGYLAALGMINLLMIFGGVDPGGLFPIAAAMSGFGFMAMGGHVWGVSAALGISFLVVAALNAWIPSASPLIFGGMWWIALAVLGRRYRGHQPQDSSSLIDS
ncbi:serine/threonine protein kinase [Crateriforma conspicua]|uniref:Serine/threonine-protein kinase PknB n=1 Tax=Crateriforma conspicua TaxID=2527996 RepID=A0A5C5Y3P0_9PLAN|nr:serine/threonine-protein kinase [Crateriforma conspicua]TWT70386.1 Serine/threonine-protein kinase PknB [Crateriforma conspicua]